MGSVLRHRRARAQPTSRHRSRVPTPRIPPDDWTDPRHRDGWDAEVRAGRWLVRRGWRIEAHRWRLGHHDLDLIARQGELVAFVEVKARSFSHQEGDALMAVNHRRIIRAAQLWLTRRPELAAEDLRFDVIFLAPFAWPRHIVSAFDATGIA